MAIFMIERNVAEKIEPNVEMAAGLKAVNDEANIRWIVSFLSADSKKSYCLYEAESPAAIRAAAEMAGIPADVIVEVTQEVLPNGIANPISSDRFQ